MEKRETRYRGQWYWRLCEEMQRGLASRTSVESIHGSLLALGELLQHTGVHVSQASLGCCWELLPTACCLPTLSPPVGCLSPASYVQCTNVPHVMNDRKGQNCSATVEAYDYFGRLHAKHQSNAYCH